ncbi:MAG TPA: MTH1187 family thiamine-binding protein [Candidatus Goldiibacteriota bacterium]|nr:MTH1187 family thiamine-binding protein [Candidatus Goldiibacteriota bacterium]HRQ44118.1 MTH1187 family thiamine-binding protein [Candidatus Goldiibacteriota bacterium]
MAIMDISIVPIGTNKTSVSEYLVKAIKILQENGVKYHICPMGTVVEADVKDLYEYARTMHEEVFSDIDVQRVVVTIKIDDRRDIHGVTMEKKVKSLGDKVRYKK